MSTDGMDWLRDSANTSNQSGGNWEKEVIQGTINDRKFTVILGKDGKAKDGHTLISDGIVNKTQLDAKHDHFSRDSKPGDKGDRGNSHVPNT